MAKTSKGMAASSYRSVGKTYDGVTILQPKTRPTHTTTAKIRSTIKDVVGNLYVEKHPNGDYAVRRMSTAERKQKESSDAVARAHKLEQQSNRPRKGEDNKRRKP